MNSANPRSRALYLQCVAIFFASSLLVNPHRNHRFYTDTDDLHIGDFDLRTALSAWGVGVTRLALTRRLPLQYAPNWRNQFYVLDILEHFIAESRGDALALFDADMLWRRPIDGMERGLQDAGVLTLLVDESDTRTHAINGVSEVELDAFVQQAYGSSQGVVRYVGGELLAGTRRELTRVAAAVPSLWEATILAHNEGRPAPREEAHFLSAAYHHLGYRAGTANHFVKRLWTGLRYRNVTPPDAKLDVWHLPAEKRVGLAHLFRLLHASRADLVAFERRVRDAGGAGAVVGVPKSTLRHQLRHATDFILRRLRVDAHA
jgi:hypothetical protein